MKRSPIIVNVVLTPSFSTGTDRVNWAANNLGAQYINLQGDEPLIQPEAIHLMGEHVLKSDSTSFTIYNGVTDLQNNFAYDTNNVKAVLNLDRSIYYLSRKAIRNSCHPNHSMYIKQLGLYSFHIDNFEERFSTLPQSPLELAEKIEMLRWIDHSHQLRAVLLSTPSISVDTPRIF